MIKMAAEATIHRPADEVFAYLVDLFEWQANVLQAAADRSRCDWPSLDDEHLLYPVR